EGKLRGLAAGADKKQQGSRGDNGVADGEASAARDVRDFGETERAEIPGDEEHSQQESGIADAVNDECLVARVGGGLAMEIKTNQQIRTQAHALPPDKHEDVVVGQD